MEQRETPGGCSIFNILHFISFQCFCLWLSILNNKMSGSPLIIKEKNEIFFKIYDKLM